MTLQERFDNIIKCIETLVKSGEHDIPHALANQTGLNLRLLGDAFQFITDMTLIKYIRQRRLVHALTDRLELNLPIEQVVSDAGFSDAAAFSKACKNEFDLSPTQITEDILESYTPLFFSRITSGEDVDQLENDKLVAAKKKDTICGISAEQFAEVKQVLELGALYGLTDEEAEFVYRLTQYCNVTTEQAAEFFEDFKLQMENGSFLGGQDLFELAELACEHNLSFSEAQSIMYEINQHGYYSIRDLPDGFFDIYFCSENDRCGWYVPYICEILEALESNGFTSADFEDVLYYVSIFGIDPIDAIENYQEYKDSWDDMVADAMSHSIIEDDTDGFGYRSIWELPEE